MWISVNILKESTFEIKPALSTSTYDPDLIHDIEFVDICEEGNGSNSRATGGGGKNTVNVAIIPLQETY